MPPTVSTLPKLVSSQSPSPPKSDMSLNHSAQPAATVIQPSVVMTFATFRFFTATVRSGIDEGPTSAADGPMNPTNRNAEPTHSTPAMMCRNRKTRKNGSAATT